MTDADKQPSFMRKLSTTVSGISLPALGIADVKWNQVDSRFRKVCCMGFLPAVIACATTGSFLFGLNTAVLNTAMTPIASNFQWCGKEALYDTGCKASKLRGAFINTAVFLGAAAGAMTVGRFTNSGLRLCLLITLAIFTVGVVGSVLADGFMSLLLARLIVGYGVGMTSVITPAYISEMAPAKKRGTYGVMHQLVLVIGQVIAVFVGLAFKAMPETDGEKAEFKGIRTFDKIWWRFMLGLGIIPVLLAGFLFGYVFTFETPNYYMRKGDKHNAEKLLKRIHNKEDVSQEMSELERNSVKDTDTGHHEKLGSLLKKPGYSRALWVGIGMSAFQQLTGINAFITNSNALFSGAGLVTKWVTWASIGLLLVNLLCTFIPLFVVDKLGRRTLLLIGSMGMAFSVMPATLLYIAEWNDDKNSKGLTSSAIAGACLFMVFFAVAAGPITWLYLFEIFPMDIKARAASICVAVNWLCSIVMVFGASYLPPKASYAIFFGFSLLYIMFVLFFVRETKGRTMGDSPYTNPDH